MERSCVGSVDGGTSGSPARRERFDSDSDAYTIHPLFPGTSTEQGPESATQLRLYEVDMWTAAELNRRWHSMLPRTDIGNLLCGTTSVAYAAEFQDRYYAVAIWSQPIVASLCDGHTIELRRLAICREAPQNTASRLLAVMRRLVRKKYPSMVRAISYLAVDVHSGTIYKASGWTVVGEVVGARPQRMSGQGQRATAPLQTKSRKQRWEMRF